MISFGNKTTSNKMKLQVGDKALDFCLVSHLGDKICLTDYLGKKNVLIAFFPLSWTPI